MDLPLIAQNGLLREILELRAIARQGEAPTDYTRGIFQAIGYKEFDAYLEHCEQRSDEEQARAPASLRPHPGDLAAVQLFDQAVEEMKVASRQFAKKQVAWVRNKLYPDIVKRKSNDVRFYSLDASGACCWQRT